MISVCIPAYNAGPWLRESLDSVLAQVVSQPVEVLVVDDGSTDDTPRILASYGSRIRVVPGPHAGLGPARDACLTHARGDLIAFQDADDIALPDRLAASLAWLEAHAGFDGVLADGERMTQPPSRVVPRAIGARCRDRALTPADLFDEFPVFWQSGLVRRTAFATAGPFDPALLVQTDLDVGYRMVARCRIGFLDRIVFRYRLHDTNITRDRLRGRDDMARILEKLLRDDPAAVDVIGRRRLVHRLARHHYRLARVRRDRGDVTAARTHCERALALRPLHLRARLMELTLPRASQTRS